jgi:hypothetical protein
MTTELRLTELELFSTGTAKERTQPCTRSLGGAIFWLAILDYRRLDQAIHEDAEKFLYPLTPEWQGQYEWALALTEGVNAAWLRDALDRFKGAWDRQRCSRKRRGHEKRKHS